MKNVMHSPVLVLNSSYEALHVCSARRALTLVVKDVAIIQHDTGNQVHAGIMFPSVIRLKSYRRVPHRAQRLTRKNILVRDGHQCQYCGEMFSAMVLTLDHVIPRSKGGLSTWDNLVACCGPCKNLAVRPLDKASNTASISSPLARSLRARSSSTWRICSLLSCRF